MFHLPVLPYDNFEFAEQSLNSVLGALLVALRVEKLKAGQQGKWEGLQISVLGGIVFSGSHCRLCGLKFCMTDKAVHRGSW